MNLSNKIIKKINDIRIKYIKLLTHKGASYSRNIGIKKAKGRYISFLDSDDVFLPEKLKIQINNLIKHNSDLDFCKVKRISRVHKRIFPNEIQINIIKNGNIYDELLTHGNFISTQTILVKKEYIEKYLFDEDMPRLQDYELLIRMLPSIKVSFTNKILVNSYLQRDSISIYRPKLLKAARLLLKKKYSLSIEQKRNFSKFLYRILRKK
jgi:glycosyltransferase involved in cell wall biosynthesis